MERAMSIRDLCVALVASFATLVAVAITQPRVLVAGSQPASSPAVMGSTAVDWNDMTVRKTKVGESRQVFRAPTATLDELELHITTLMPGQTPHPPHQHPDEEVLIVREGTVETFLGDRTQRIGPGSVIFQAANQRHTIRNVGDTPATYHVIKWNSPGMLKKRAEAQPE
jgi:quercetin dioxygenase-like cupin family protein